MNRPLTAVLFILVATGIAVSSFFYIKSTHKIMTEHCDKILESVKKDDKEEIKKDTDNALKQWEKRDDLLNVFIGQKETNDVKKSLSLAVFFARLGDTESVILHISECKAELERLKNANEPSISTIL